VADKIRALAAAGYPRADIARFLGKRYQHVRNVLQDDAQTGAQTGAQIGAQTGGQIGAPAGVRAVAQTGGQTGGGYVIGRADLSGLREPHGFEEAPAEPYAVDAGVALLRLPVRDDGAMTLPAMALQALGLRPGGVALAELDGERLTIFSVQESVRRIQAMARDLVEGDHSLADGLIAERREEAARETPGPQTDPQRRGGREDG